jgi:uncharacterized metal-binding protein YceD (DUF177 family)
MKVAAMTDTHDFRVADLPQNSATAFDLRPAAGELKAIADELGLNGLRKLRLTGTIRARGKQDWQLKADLGATVVQDCVVTLDPVTTRIDQPVERVYLAELAIPQEEEAEIHEDDSAEQLGSHIDVREVMIEALALALPQYPRKAEVELGEAVYTEPGSKPMTDKDARPFAGLANLRDQLEQDE